MKALNVFQLALKNYGETLDSGGDDGNALAYVRAALLESLDLPAEAVLDLEPHEDALLGVLSFRGIKGSVISMAIGIDNLGGSIVIGKPLHRKAVLESFNMSVRISADQLKLYFDRVHHALAILPKERRTADGSLLSEGHSVIGITDNGTVITTTAPTEVMLPVGFKNHCCDKTAIVVFKLNAPDKITPESILVERNGNEATLELRARNERYIVRPFPNTKFYR